MSRSTNTTRPAARERRGRPALRLAALALLLAAAAPAGAGTPGAAVHLAPAVLPGAAEPAAGEEPGAGLAADSLLEAEEADAPALDSTAAVASPPAVRAFGERPATVRKVRLHRRAHNVARTGPGDGYAIAGVHRKGATFTVVAKRGEWIGVQLTPSETGWFHASLCREFDDLSDLEFHPNPRLYSRTGSYALAAYGGAYAFDRKSNSLVLGGRLGYYVFDRLQAEAGVAWTHVRRPAEIVESLFGLTLEAEDFHLLFYQLNLVWEVLPGRQMVPFATVGVGSSIMQGDTEPSFNFGAGTTLFLSKRTAMRWEVRDYRFETGPEDARRANHNIEFTLGTVFLF